MHKGLIDNLVFDLNGGLARLFIRVGQEVGKTFLPFDFSPGFLLNFSFLENSNGDYLADLGLSWVVRVSLIVLFVTLGSYEVSALE